MSSTPAVIVRKSGFFSSLFFSVFGFLTVVVLVAGGCAFYAISVVDRTAGGIINFSGHVISGLPDWQHDLPPMLAEMLDDRRAPDYRSSLDITAETRPSSRVDGEEVTVVEIKNSGSETVSVLALTVVLEDDDHIPLFERRIYAATPLVIDKDDWRGPLMPGSSRRFLVSHFGHEPGLHAAVDIAELRLWNGPRENPAPASAAATSEAAIP